MKKFKAKWLIILMIILVAAGVYSVVDKTTNLYDAKVENSELSTIELGKGDSVSQSFVTKEDHLDGMEVKMMGSGDMEKVSVCFRLEDSDGNQIAEQTCSLDDLKNGRFYEVKFGRIEQSSGKKYTYTIEVDKCDDESEVTLYYTKGHADDRSLSKGKEAVDGELVLRTIAHRFDIETFIVSSLFLLYVAAFLGWLGKLFK